MVRTKFRIALGDLRHATIGRHSIFMPIGISYIASYLLGHLNSDDIEVRLFDDPDKLLNAVKEWKPNIIGLSNYCWNVEISNLVFKHAKKENPYIVCIAGGPEFPIDDFERKEYLLFRKNTDFYVMYEGEIAFSRLIQKIIDGAAISYLKANPQDNIASIHPDTGGLILGDLTSRLKNLDDIDSPYLNGLLDDWFNGSYAPSVEFARGCPFSCGYCYAGQSYYTPMATFSVDRIQEELTHIAKKMVDFPNILLSICDSNFGMKKRDEEIAKTINDIQDMYNWPNVFDVTTGKANFDRILRIASLLKNKMYITCSVQSLNPETLDIIKRKNLPIDEYIEVQSEIRKRNMPSVAELIIPMPQETKESFFDSIKTLFNTGVKSIVPYTTMLLKGTFLASKSAREDYKMDTKFRLIPRQFGEYGGEKCFEIEEVCIATSTMTFQDYLDCRGFALISSVLSSVQFDIVHRHLKELGIKTYEFLIALLDMINSGKTKISDIYNKYLDETQKELWDKREHIIDYFSKSENYDKLIAGDLGDNLIRKYSTIIFLEYNTPLIDLLYQVIQYLSDHDKQTQDIQDSLDAAKKWIIACRDISRILENEDSIQQIEELDLNFDVLNWYTTNPEEKTLDSFKKNVGYKIFYDVNIVKRILDEGKQLWGDEILYRFGKLLINWSINNFWRNCEPR